MPTPPDRTGADAIPPYAGKKRPMLQFQPLRNQDSGTNTNSSPVSSTTPPSKNHLLHCLRKNRTIGLFVSVVSSGAEFLRTGEEDLHLFGGSDRDADELSGQFLRGNNEPESAWSAGTRKTLFRSSGEVTQKGNSCCEGITRKSELLELLPIPLARLLHFCRRFRQIAGIAEEVSASS